MCEWKYIAVSAQLMAETPYTLQWVTLSAKIAPSHGGIWTPSNSWFLKPDRTDNPNGITIGSAVFAQVTTECPYTLQWAPLSPKIAHSHGESGPHLTRNSFGPSEPTNQMASLSVQPFLHRWLQSVPILYSGTLLSPLKIAPSHGWIWTPIYCVVPWTHPSPQPKWHLNQFSRFSRAHLCDRETDRPTDHATGSVTIDCIYVRSTAMRPNNFICQQEFCQASMRYEVSECLLLMCNWD